VIGQKLYERCLQIKDQIDKLFICNFLDKLIMHMSSLLVYDMWQLVSRRTTPHPWMEIKS